MTPTVEYPSHLSRQRALPDGRPVLIRPVHPDDAPHEWYFLAHLSPEARRNRFQGWAGPIDRRLADFYTRVDYDRHMAFICAAEQDGADLIVGEARYLANADGESCEFGVVVADAWRHTGVAELLMQSLMAAARDKGLRTMASLVLSDNKAMLDFARELGFEVQPVEEDPAHVRIVKKLGR
jgi:acetyltransferase